LVCAKQRLYVNTSHPPARQTPIAKELQSDLWALIHWEWGLGSPFPVLGSSYRYLAKSSLHWYNYRRYSAKISHLQPKADELLEILKQAYQYSLAGRSLRQSDEECHNRAAPSMEGSLCMSENYNPRTGKAPRSRLPE
jgi:hypothetical protein